MDGQHTPSAPDGAIASYRSVVDSQIDSITELEDWLKDRCASNTLYQDIATSVSFVLASNKARLLEVRSTGVWSPPPASSTLRTISWTRTSANTVTVNGLGLDPQRRFELHPQDGDISSVENFAGLLASALDHMAATEGHISRLARLISDMKASPVGGSHCEIVHNHIRLLGEYNDAKDIAQQLIGLIADNRGVSVSSLYQGERYGVGPND